MSSGRMSSLEVLFLERAYLYELFHKLMGGAPNGELLGCVASPATFGIIERYSADWDDSANMERLADVFRRPHPEGFLDALASEYSRLLWGMGKAISHPWESTYVAQEPVVFQRSTLDVRAAYQAEGLRAKLQGKVPDDHVSLMCKFMSTMSIRVLESFREGRVEGVRETLAGQRSFAESHMIGWIPRYAEDLAGADSGMYLPQVASALAEFVRNDLVFMAGILAWLSGLDVSEGEAASDVVLGDTSELEEAYAALRALRLFGIEENEFVECL